MPINFQHRQRPSQRGPGPASLAEARRCSLPERRNASQGDDGGAHADRGERRVALVCVFVIPFELHLRCRRKAVAKPPRCQSSGRNEIAKQRKRVNNPFVPVFVLPTIGCFRGSFHEADLF